MSSESDLDVEKRIELGEINAIPIDDEENQVSITMSDNINHNSEQTPYSEFIGIIYWVGYTTIPLIALDCIAILLGNIVLGGIKKDIPNISDTAKNAISGSVVFWIALMLLKIALHSVPLLMREQDSVEAENTSKLKCCYECVNVSFHLIYSILTFPTYMPISAGPMPLKEVATAATSGAIGSAILKMDIQAMTASGAIGASLCIGTRSLAENIYKYAGAFFAQRLNTRNLSDRTLSSEHTTSPEITEQNSELNEYS